MKYKHGLYFDYPEDLHAHMISPKQVRDVALDGKFPYYNKGFWFRVLQVLVQIVMILIVFPANYFRYGLKIKGKSRISLIWESRSKRSCCICSLSICFLISNYIKNKEVCIIVKEKICEYY